ncbi:N-terminal Xaa-Pro-Lys N-methyltransferase 1 isoform X2 [Narcine bancroftii]|uniref:N-terminal Xaa-Pro-Lys N-methyltransferase 1 isoform X2 n=1 Tax=Narcine bancroftii TaxID=1343680 RepID=UPI0038320068
MTAEVIGDDDGFYSRAKKYWKNIPPTVDGMLGGYGHISSIDINSSKKFLLQFIEEGSGKAGTSCALDCGAGIGRITKRLLLPLFKVVDMVDVTEDFLAKAKTHLGEEGKRVDNYFCCGLQDFIPQPQRYDVIWIQWVIVCPSDGDRAQGKEGGVRKSPGHLTDDHLIQFLKRCQKGLRPNGIICVKDNVSQEGVIEDEVDSSVCRDLGTLHTIVQLAGLQVLAEEKQDDFPDEIYQVYSLALSFQRRRERILDSIWHLQ